MLKPLPLVEGAEKVCVATALHTADILAFALSVEEMILLKKQGAKDKGSHNCKKISNGILQKLFFSFGHYIFFLLEYMIIAK